MNAIRWVLTPARRFRSHMHRKAKANIALWHGRYFLAEAAMWERFLAMPPSPKSLDWLDRTGNRLMRVWIKRIERK